jgi:DNA-directed RNA polymerase specialized sigma24 family protein
MPEANLEQALPMAMRAVRVRAAAAVATGRAAATDREDLEQEALLGLWVALRQYDPSRASVRTFVERVAEKRFASLLRRGRIPLVIESLDSHQFPTFRQSNSAWISSAS